MTRPAIIIGLGGTGQWVVTYLKKDLLEIGGGVLPPGVRLLSFDTTSDPTAGTGDEGSKKEEQAVRAGAVKLTKDIEFIPMGDNVLNLAQEIAQGKYSYLNWFPARDFLATLPPAAFNLKDGAGAIRHMGRIGFFRDIANPAKSKILSNLKKAIRDVKDEVKVNEDSRLEIIIIGSMAGGTGAGMLVDMAHIVRAQAQRLSENYIVRGFFVGPRAFTRGALGESTEMWARSFAAWRELDRFMIVSKRFGAHKQIYHPTIPDLQLNIDTRAYDATYIIDPVRTNAPLDNEKPEESIFPAIAQAISAILDEIAGKDYSEFITTNYSGKLNVLPRKAYHAGIGTYTLKVPVYYAKEKFAHSMGKDILENLLKPVFDKNGNVQQVSELDNGEAPEGQVGKSAVLSFMAADELNVGNEKVPNTRFMPLLSEIRLKEAQRDGRIIDQIARGGLTNERNRFLLAITEIGQDEKGKLITRDITDELQIPVWRVIPPSHDLGDTPETAYLRIKNKIPDFIREHYGQEDVKEHDHVRRGKYGNALETAKKAQLERIRELFTLWTRETLNGYSIDPIIAKSGKIGYVRSFFEEVINTCIYFNGFIDLVRKERSETKRLATQTKESANRALQEYNRLKSKKCWLCFWDNNTHPDAHRAQRNYLMAVQRDIDRRKDDVLLDVLSETSTELRKFAEKTLEEIENWVAHLAVGDPERDIKGLYPELIKSLENVNVNNQADKNLNSVIKILGEHEYQFEVDQLADALDRINWGVKGEADGLEISCEISFPSQIEDEPDTTVSLRDSGDKPSEYNLRNIIRLGERPFLGIHTERPIAKEIVNEYPTGRELAENVYRLADPFYQVSNTQANAQFITCYVRVHSNIDAETTEYFHDFEKSMKDRNAAINTFKVIDSEDKHKMTIVRSDDLIPSSNFEMWHSCQEAYLSMFQNAEIDQSPAKTFIFEAEQNAAEFELRMPSYLGQNYRTLHPEVVALLEDKDHLSWFLYSVALGFIKEIEEEGQSFWAYKISGMKDYVYLSQPSDSLAVGFRQDDIFVVLYNFVLEGKDQRPGKGEISWVDWRKLHREIINQENGLGVKKAVKLYRDQIEKPDGIVQTILNDIETCRSQCQDETVRQYIGAEHQDLADLAKLIYLLRIEHLEN